MDEELLRALDLSKKRGIYSGTVRTGGARSTEGAFEGDGNGVALDN
jgi:hypothetical protein